MRIQRARIEREGNKEKIVMMDIIDELISK